MNISRVEQHPQEVVFVPPALDMRSLRVLLRDLQSRGIDYGLSTHLGDVNTRVTELAELHKHDTQDLYALLKDAQDSRSRISQRVDMDSQRVDLLMGDRMTL
ncbi:hypothetical protein Tco_0993657 [Tanacetum coccineum]